MVFRIEDNKGFLKKLYALGFSYFSASYNQKLGYYQQAQFMQLWKMSIILFQGAILSTIFQKLQKEVKIKITKITFIAFNKIFCFKVSSGKSIEVFFIIFSEHEFQVWSICQFNSVLQYDYIIYGKK